MKNKFILVLLLLLDIVGINALCRMLNRKKAIILWYHGICDEGFTLTKRHIPTSVFRKQLGYLKRKGYIFVSMSELVSVIKNKKKIDKYVTLTFDDGFRNIVENAYPIMQEFNAKGCFYLVSDLTGTPNLLWTDQVEIVIRNQRSRNFQFIFKTEIISYELGNEELYQHAFEDIKARLRMLPDNERLEHLKQFSIHNSYNVPKEFIMASWEQIKELDPNILEIGGHTKRHPNCTNLTTDDELEDEIYNSKIDIERNIDRKVDHFCYPAGSYNDKVISKVKKYGYESAVTVENGFINENSDLYRLKRKEINEQFLLFKTSISGSLNMLRSIKNLVKKPIHLNGYVSLKQGG